MAVPAVAGGKLVIDQWDNHEARLDALEATGVAAITLAVATSAATSSTTYTGTLSTGATGPAVAVVLAAGQDCLIIIGCECANGGGQIRSSFAVSGAATEAATDARGTHNATLLGLAMSKATLYTAGSAGTYTFQQQYRVSASTGTFLNRNIIAIPCPVPT